ncbi:hypothetical protein B0H66DRAFT_555490 [Apodospora peruviana]|uniref:Zn(2)-C6 fungal-type domain-containing protein n=1 Tax=Apodospora peruviana TaxID=516989 RepID=A0AAE0ID48_9PEZI|nr:hypothetical protein B0H66DRAFT_555490 [Apodospora peruviana]
MSVNPPFSIIPAGQDPTKRACFKCAKSKLRCTWPDDMQQQTTRRLGQSDHPICKRCKQRGFPCWVAEAGKRGPQVGHRAGKNKIEKLEKKVDDILSLLKTTTPNSAQASAQLGIEGVSDSTTWGGSSSPTSSQQPINELSALQPPNNCPLDHDAADKILHNYRTNYSPRFPFVQIPSTTSVFQLVLQRPFLFKVIAHVVAPPKNSSRAAFHQWFLSCLMDKMTREQDKTLELLQAILIFIAWGDYYLCGDSRGSEILLLAMSLVSDLGLDEPPDSMAYGSPSDTLSMTPPRRADHTLPEQRAVLGCFYITSAFYPVLRRRAALPFTKYMSKCCEHLAQTTRDGDPSDAYLVGLVRMQLLATQGSEALLPRAVVGGGKLSLFNEVAYMTMTSVQADAKRINDTLPKSVTDDALLWTVNYHATVVRTLSAAIDMPATETETGGRRIEVLCRCLQTCLEVVEAFVAIPAADVAFCPVTTSCSLALALLTLRRLLLFGDRDWDALVARQNLDFPGLLSRLGQHFEEAYLIDRERQTREEGLGIGSSSLFGAADDGANNDAMTSPTAAGQPRDDETGQGVSANQDDADDGSFGTGVYGYWKKVKWLRSWYISEVSLGLVPTMTGGAMAAAASPISGGQINENHELAMDMLCTTLKLGQTWFPLRLHLGAGA